jgi:origin recognition complex subunit 4
MLHQLFRDQVRISIAAPVQVEGGGSIGMVKCSRQVMMGVSFHFISLSLRTLSHFAVLDASRDCTQAFEHLVNVRVFVSVAAASSMVAREFVKYRSSVEREVVKGAVEKLGTTSLKKWLGKSQQVHN